MESAQTIGKIVYEEAAKAQAAAGAPGPAGATPGAEPSGDQPPKGDDVIDADFEVKESK
jgi:hypothetical protein